MQVLKTMYMHKEDQSWSEPCNNEESCIQSQIMANVRSKAISSKTGDDQPEEGEWPKQQRCIVGFDELVEGHPLQLPSLMLNDDSEAPHDYSSIAECVSDGRDEICWRPAVSVNKAEEWTCQSASAVKLPSELI